ncbi:hypothetical protein Herbaro_09240 [Herbaspirillum sp. WKF16]|uniref:hypothetical protein n=1 Tax=Herbaspirillum sp. WKF16 TaxID=3028312 RepID=UPI0023A9C739|nr:hypothetical protein [Herbaspirillum sp. WKF16]WDZ97944.1 hypothetical protein Herbaro_09240 [Herbaspirillum sp. WKF16]
MADDKYKAACVEYFAAQAEVKATRKAIGEHLEACRSKAVADWKAENPGSFEFAPAEQWQKSPHLADAYARGSDGWDEYYLNHDDDVEGFLAETCQHCLQAHHAIQAKKAATKRFGVAKRRITVLGGAA